MEYLPAPLEKLVEEFASLPGIGGKSAQRLAFHVLSLSDQEAQDFADAILEAKRTVTCCPVCRNLTAGGLCPICASPSGTRPPSAWWRTPGTWWLWSGPGSTPAATTSSTASSPP